MADEIVINGDYSDAQTVEIGGDDESSKVSVLTQKISDLERENGKIIQQNEDYREKIKELKASIQELSSESVERKKEMEDLQSENRTLGSVAARAAELEGMVSMLQQDLMFARGELEESILKISDLKRDLEGVKEREKEKDAKLDAIGKERDLLLAKVGKLEEEGSGLRGESDVKKKEIRILKKNLEELEVVLESNKVLQKLRSGLEKTVEQLTGKISVLENSLDEKEKVIIGFEMKERAIEENINGDALLHGEKNGSIGGLKGKEWFVVGASTIAAVGVMGAVCYVHAARKH